MMIMNAPRIYVGFLLGRELTWRKAILKVWGRMSPIKTLADHVTGLARSRLESHN